MTPLELWDFSVGGKSLFAARDDDDFCARLAAAVRLWRARYQLSRVWLGGGGVAHAELATAMATIGLPFTLSRHGQYCGAPGGFWLAGTPHPLVVDVGQTAVKLMWPGGARRVARDFTRLPVDERPDARRALRDFIAGAIVQARAEAHAVDCLVLALPAEVDDALVPSACSYAGLAGDAQLVADVRRLARLDDVPALVLNDAELAAVTAQREPPDGEGNLRTDLDGSDGDGETTLVLTLGYGVGGALARR